LTAGIDNAGLLEHGQQVCVGYGFLRCRDDMLQNEEQVIIFTPRCFGRIDYGARDREDGSFHWLHALVGRLAGLARMACVRSSAPNLDLLSNDLAKPRQSCERITPELPRAPSARRVRLFARLCRHSLQENARSHAGTLHSEEHVGARVTIGHGENVEGVDARLVIAQPQQAGFHQPLQALSIFIQQFVSSICGLGSQGR
jgi:hypothetical protein